MPVCVRRTGRANKASPTGVPAVKNVGFRTSLSPCVLVGLGDRLEAWNLAKLAHAEDFP